MREARHRFLPAERTIKQDVQGRGGQPLFAADYVTDFHQMIIDNIGQMISRQAVSVLIEHLIVQDRRIDDHVATDNVVDVNIFARFNLEAHYIINAFLQEARRFVRRKRERIAHLHTRRSVILKILYLPALGIQLFGRIKGVISLAFVEQLIDVAAIDFAPFALAVRPVLTAETYPFIKIDAEPFEALQDIVFGSRHKAIGVRVFDTKNEFPAMLASK